MHMRLNNVTLAHNGAVILKNVSIDLPPGCRLGLVGSSGAGKAPLLVCSVATSTPQRARCYSTDKTYAGSAYVVYYRTSVAFRRRHRS